LEEKIFFCTFAVIKETQQKSFMGRNLKSIVFVLLALMCVEPLFSQESMDKMWGSSGSSGASPAKEGRGRLFSWGNYAMFIHWGLYSSLGNVWNGNTYYGISEWILNKNMANIDRSEYRAIAKCHEDCTAGKGCGHEVYRHHEQAPRGFRHVSLYGR